MRLPFILQKNQQLKLYTLFYLEKKSNLNSAVTMHTMFTFPTYSFLEIFADSMKSNCSENEMCQQLLLLGNCRE